MKHPCMCPDMLWMMNHEKVFKYEDGFWVLSWIELDKTDKGKINIGHFGVKVKYCPFCGKEIRQN